VALAQPRVSVFVKQRRREADTVPVGKLAYRRASGRAGEVQVQMRLGKRPQFAHKRKVWHLAITAIRRALRAVR
jgi:hypothetical protein